MSVVALGEDLGIEGATDLKQRLAVHVAEPQLLSLDASAVRRVHTASLQLLCTLVRERERSGYPTEISEASDAFRDAARILGLTVQLGLQQAPQQRQEQTVENAA